MPYRQCVAIQLSIAAEWQTGLVNVHWTVFRVKEAARQVLGGRHRRTPARQAQIKAKRSKSLLEVECKGEGQANL